MQITRVKNDINGNSRRVIHFLELLTHADRAALPIGPGRTSAMCSLALTKARKIGGKKFHNRQYGGGIVFQAYTDAEVEHLVARALVSA